MSKSPSYLKDLNSFQELLPVQTASRRAKVPSIAVVEEMLKENLGTTLPSDYMAFTSIYGEVTFGVEKQSEIVSVYSPQNKYYLKSVLGLIDAYSDLKQVEGDNCIPFAIHPERSGLLPWGQGVGRRAYFWLTSGKPELWKVVYLTPEDKFVHTDMSFMTFMLAVFTGKVDLGGDFDKEWFLASRGTFVSRRR